MLVAQGRPQIGATRMALDLPLKTGGRQNVASGYDVARQTRVSLLFLNGEVDRCGLRWPAALRRACFHDSATPRRLKRFGHIRSAMILCGQHFTDSYKGCRMTWGWRRPRCCMPCAGKAVRWARRTNASRDDARTPTNHPTSTSRKGPMPPLSTLTYDPRS